MSASSRALPRPRLTPLTTRGSWSATTQLYESLWNSALSTGSTDLREAVRALARRLMQAMDVDSCEIHAIDHGSLRLIAGCDADGFADAWKAWSAPLTEFPTTAAGVDAAEVVVVEDLDDPRLTDHERERMRDYGLRSEICVPLMVEDKVVGIIDVFDTRPRRYEEYVDFLRGVAPVVARARERPARRPPA
jgi:GAF domain-containing protein